MLGDYTLLGMNVASVHYFLARERLALAVVINCCKRKREHRA